jgi:hypothetical protein
MTIRKINFPTCICLGSDKETNLHRPSLALVSKSPQTRFTEVAAPKKCKPSGINLRHTFEVMGGFPEARPKR